MLGQYFLILPDDKNQLECLLEQPSIAGSEFLEKGQMVQII